MISSPHGRATCNHLFWPTPTEGIAGANGLRESCSNSRSLPFEYRLSPGCFRARPRHSRRVQGTIAIYPYLALDLQRPLTRCRHLSSGIPQAAIDGIAYTSAAQSIYLSLLALTSIGYGAACLCAQPRNRKGLSVNFFRQR
jgi:hypothetical protein